MDVVDWLLDSDPSIRWQVMRDLTDTADDVVAAERSRVATEGWGARLLALQEPDGQWDGGTYQPGWADPYVYVPAWTSTTYTLLLLRDLGLDPASEEAQRAVALVRDNSKWEHDGQDFFDGEVEPCINGMAVALGAYFGQDVGASSTGCSASRWLTVDGTVSRRTARRGARSIRPSRYSTVSSNMTRRPGARPK